MNVHAAAKERMMLIRIGFTTLRKEHVAPHQIMILK
jgi:hypothetical protein